MSYPVKTQFVVDFLHLMVAREWSAARERLSEKSFRMEYCPASMGAGGASLVHTSIERWQGYFDMTTAAVKDFTIEVMDTIESDSENRVMVFTKAKTGEGLATGRPYGHEFVVMFRLATEDGALKITEMKEFVDSIYALKWLPEERKAVADAKLSK